MDYTNTTKLKQRLARILRSSSPCSSSTSASIFSSGAATTSRTFSTDTPRNPLLIPGRRPPLLDLLSLNHSPPLHPRHRRPPPRFKLNCTRTSDATTTKKERRITETGLFYHTGEHEGSMCPPASPTTHSKRTLPTKKKLLTNSYGFTSSSPSSDDEFGFSSEDRDVDAIEEKFFSTRSFSSDSSEFYSNPKPKNELSKKKKIAASRRHPPSRFGGCRPVVSARREEGECGFAVVKKSSDPYEDFRTSMVEMIVERQKFGAVELELLLQSYLSLNSPRHHPAIIKAFSDIWEVLFAN